MRGPSPHTGRTPISGFRKLSLSPNQAFLTKSVDSLWKRSWEWPLDHRKHPTTERRGVYNANYIFLKLLNGFLRLIHLFLNNKKKRFWFFPQHGSAFPKKQGISWVDHRQILPAPTPSERQPAKKWRRCAPKSTTTVLPATSHHQPFVF